MLLEGLFIEKQGTHKSLSGIGFSPLAGINESFSIVNGCVSGDPSFNFSLIIFELI